MKRTCKSLLFSDIKGYSGLTERECLAFCRIFHAGVQNDVLGKYDSRIILKNTWGDALHVVMDDVVTAAGVALDLRDWIDGTDWIKLGFRTKLTARIGLHAGIVAEIPDPITGKSNFVGCNTSKAARIEPIAQDGQVFVSQAFAALLALHPDSGFICEYVGERTLPKNYGKTAVFSLSRK